MNVLKVGSTAPAPTVIPPPPIPGEVEGRRGGESSAPKSAVDVVGGGIQRASATAAKEAQPAGPFDHIARDRAVQGVVEKVNETLESFGATSIRFSYDQERQLVVMQVVRAAEGAGQPEEVIRQIPPEDLLELVDRLKELQGVIFDGRA
jgi:uncharacterized FlaG/YvyC family protein